MTIRWSRWAPMTGLLFALVVFVALLVSGKAPNSDSSAASVVHFYVVHKNGQNASSHMVSLSVPLSVAFAIILALSVRDGPRSVVPAAVGRVGSAMTAVVATLLRRRVVRAGSRVAPRSLPSRKLGNSGSGRNLRET